MPEAQFVRERPRILIVVPAYYPAERFGGPVRSIHDLAKGLVRSGFDVTVFTTNSNGADDLSVAIGVPIDRDGVMVRYFQVKRPRSYFYSPSLGRAVRDSGRNFHLIYVAWMYVYTTAVAAQAAFRQNIPYILSPRGMLDTNAVAQKSRLKKLAYLALTGSRQVRRAARVHFTSMGEWDNSIVNVAAGRELIVPNGIVLDEDKANAGDLDLSSLGIPAGKPFILFLGRLSYIKGLDLLSEAWPMVLRENPDCHLVIAGPDDEGLYGAMRAGFENAGISSSVSYLGLVGSELKAALLKQCALLISPSYLESFGMSIVEAMSQRKVVIVTNRVNIATDIERARAGVVTQCDARQIADATISLLSDPARAATMGKAGRTLVEDQYLLESTSKRMATAISSIVGGGKQARTIQ